MTLDGPETRLDRVDETLPPDFGPYRGLRMIFRRLMRDGDPIQILSGGETGPLYLPDLSFTETQLTRDLHSMINRLSGKAWAYIDTAKILGNFSKEKSGYHWVFDKMDVIFGIINRCVITKDDSPQGYSFQIRGLRYDDKKGKWVEEKSVS